MRAVFNRILAAMLLATICVVATASLRGQAPAGAQGGAQPPQNAPSQTPPPPPPKQESGVTISVEAPIVTVDAVAATQHGDLVMGLKKENFKITDDGVPQTITGFSAGDSPITMA